MSPEYVRPYVKAQKNDDRDAEPIAEAATRPTVPLQNHRWRATNQTQARYETCARVVLDAAIFL